MDAYIKMSFVLVVYFYLLVMGWSYLVINVYPRLFKFVNKGMAEKEETRISGMRVLLKFHFSDSYIFKAFNVLFIIVMLLVMYDHITLTKAMIATGIYLVAHLIYTTVYMLVEYISIRNLD